MLHQRPSNSVFTHDALICVRTAQSAFAEVLTDAGLGGARPTEVGRILGLDKTLAWKVSRFTDSTDIVNAVKHIPGAGGAEIVLKAARANGVKEDLIRAAREADTAFRIFIRQHAGDRRSFETMLAAGGRDETIELEERRAHFRSGSAIWGVRARVQFLTLLLRPSRTQDDRIDVLQLSGFLGFERLRSDVPWIIRRLWSSDTEEPANTHFQKTALYPNQSGSNALPMIPEFCSDPIPEINQFTGEDGVIYDEISPGLIGKHGSLNCVSGEIYSGALPKRWTPENTFGRYELMLRTPVQAVVFDVCIHSSLKEFGDFDRTVYGLLEDRPRKGRGRTHNTPMYAQEAAQRLGTSGYASILQCAKIREYGRLIESSLDRVGWEPITEFRGYRSELEYPAIPTCLTMQCPLKKPDDE